MSQIKMREGEIQDINSITRSILNGILKEIMYILETESGSLFVFDSVNEELVLDSIYNSLDPSLIIGLKQRLGEGIAGKVAEGKTPVLVKDIDRNEFFHRSGFRHYRSGSFISIPLVNVKGILLGVINLTDKSSGGSFTDRDLEIAVRLCKYACSVIDTINAQRQTSNKIDSVLEKYASVGKLAAGVVHEINNPLDGVIRYTNILLSQLEENSVERDYLLEVKKGLDRISNITHSLLEFSRQINSSVNIKRQYVDINQLIDASLDMLNVQSRSDICINKRYSHLPRILDMGLHYIVINIVRNALDAMPEGGTLDIVTGMKESMIEIIFKDTGVGMCEEVKERIFEPFFTTKEIDKGTGLGLSISNETVLRYEGRIEVESAPNKGSTFKVLIPKKYLENA
ncbi:MAG: ATP-binding protein [Candidatus Omnitrophica bacterium]|nr:ATP-binding protein [Candidatus Omnitrophota bacterium]